MVICIAEEDVKYMQDLYVRTSLDLSVDGRTALKK